LHIFSDAKLRKVEVKGMKNIIETTKEKYEGMETTHPIFKAFCDGFANGWDLYARVLGHTIMALGLIRFIGMAAFKKDIFKVLFDKEM
jgi:hypothetical protein